MNFTDRDPALRMMLDHVLSPSDRALLEPILARMGEVAANELDELAHTADRNPPRLVQYSPSGERIDEIEYHPAYDRMRRILFGDFGLARMSHHEGVNGWQGRTPHVVKYALSYLFVQSEFGIACPLSMTDSAARVLRRYDAERFAPEIEALTSTDMGTSATGAMFMTELDGGSDVGRTATEATEHGDHWTLRGRKWFCSNVGADLILTLARVPGQGEGTRGLGLFLVPRVRPDGSRNGVRIDRLKDKLGTRSMASGEVTLEDAWAQPIGELSRGFVQMAEMVNVSRLSNAMRAAAIMRRGVREAVDHTRQRKAFGRLLFDQPLMRATLLPLVLEAEASLALVLETAARLDDADRDVTGAQDLIRVLTPVAKYTLCKRARHVTGETMEIRGGNGYIEDWVDPRLLRDAHLGSIWEGSSNVIALDILRCLRRVKSHETLAQVYTRRLEQITDPDLAELVAWVRARWESHLSTAAEFLQRSEDEQQIAVAPWASEVAMTLMATLLVEHAAAQLARSQGYRGVLVARTFIARLQDPTRLPASAREHLAALADGGDVARSAALEVELDPSRPQ